MTEKRNNLFDLLRVLFTVSVVISHASGKLYHGDIVSANVAVDGFLCFQVFLWQSICMHTKTRIQNSFS